MQAKECRVSSKWRPYRERAAALSALTSVTPDSREASQAAPLRPADDAFAPERRLSSVPTALLRLLPSEALASLLPCLCLWGRKPVHFAGGGGDAVSGEPARSRERVEESAVTG